MQVIQATEKVAITNSTANAMTADASKMAKLYFMMSSTLYTDKLLSILRELCSNARDSHAEAGKLDTPFAIIAPTAQSPNLIISDVGTGIDYAKAQKTILMFLGSTKDEDDDERGFKADDAIGGWGIGAKSPRAYTSTYQIVMRLNGVETAVQVYDDKGMPQEVEMYTKKTQEPNGLNFIVPIKTTDVNIWRGKIETYMEHTNYNVEAFMGDGVVLRPSKPTGVVTYEDFTVELHGERDRYSYGRQAVRPVVLYGGMRYDIPPSFELEKELSGITALLAFGLSMKINVTRPNALKFGLSREHMELETNTLNLVTHAVRCISDDMEKAVKKEWTKIFENRTFSAYEDLMAYAKDVKDAVDAGTASRYGKYCRSFSTTASWDSSELLAAVWGRRERKLERRALSVSLPLEDDYKHPKIKVLWSDRTPSASDWAHAVSQGDRVVKFPTKTKDEKEVVGWYESLKGFEGLEYELVYVESTRSNGRAGTTGAVFATCAASGERKQIVEGTTYVTVPEARYKFLGDVFRDHFFFVPTKNFEKRMEEMPGNVYTYEEFMLEEENKAKIAATFYGFDLQPHTEVMLGKAYEAMEVSTHTLPAAITERISAAGEKVGKLWTRARRTQHRQEKYGKYANLFGFENFEDVTPALKEVNDILYVLHKYEHTFKAIDFRRLKEQLEKDNPEAKRLVIAMQLEQFL